VDSRHASIRVFEHLAALRQGFSYVGRHCIEATGEASEIYLAWEAENIEQMKRCEDPILAHWEKCHAYVAQLALARRLMRMKLELDYDGEPDTVKPGFPFQPPGAPLEEARPDLDERWSKDRFAYPRLVESIADITVEAEDMRAAVELVENVLKPHAIRVYGSVTGHPGAEIARRLVPWLVSQVQEGKTRVARSKIAARHGLKDDEKKLSEVISCLDLNGIIRPMKTLRTSDAKSFELNPGIASWTD
jgi:hypothetical protein